MSPTFFALGGEVAGELEDRRGLAGAQKAADHQIQ